jgi:hypothetical protein
MHVVRKAVANLSNSDEGLALNFDIQLLSDG